MTGLGVGWLAGYALSEPLDPAPDVVTGAFTGLGYGALFGLGTGMLLDPGDASDVRRAVTLAGGTAGGTAGAWLAWNNPDVIRADDVVLTTLASGWAGWQMGGWTEDQDLDPDLVGLDFVVPSGVGIAVAMVSPELDITTGQALSAGSLGLWGGYYGGVAADLADKDVLEWSLIGSDAGLVAGVLAMSPLVNAPPAVVGLADAGGVLGGSVAALGASFATEERKPILAASLIGAGAGAAGGAVLGVALHRRGRTHDVALPSIDPPGDWSVEPASFDADGQAAWGALVRVDRW
jgi:hypothetical protein